VLGGAGRVPRIGVAKPNVEPEVLVDADLETLAAALYVRTDDLLNDSPQRMAARAAHFALGARSPDTEEVTAMLRPPREAAS
jgi:hypothetical protein